MTRSVIIRREARRDLREAKTWYRKISRQLANDFVSRIDEAIAVAQERPLAFQLVHRTFRRILVHRFPYALFYHADEAGCVIEPRKVTECGADAVNRAEGKIGCVVSGLGDKWLAAGVLEEGAVRYPDGGTPQGGVISPLLANVYLHHVVDMWFESMARPKLRGEAFLVRYADDFVIVCAIQSDAEKLMGVLPKRFGKYGLKLHPEKTRLVRFTKPSYTSTGKGGGGGESETFDLLGFTHYWQRSYRGKGWVVQRKTGPSGGRRERSRRRESRNERGGGRRGSVPRCGAR